MLACWPLYRHSTCSFIRFNDLISRERRFRFLLCWTLWKLSQMTWRSSMFRLFFLFWGRWFWTLLWTLIPRFYVHMIDIKISIIRLHANSWQFSFLFNLVFSSISFEQKVLLRQSWAWSVVHLGWKIYFFSHDVRLTNFLPNSNFFLTFLCNLFPDNFIQNIMGFWSIKLFRCLFWGNFS